MKETLAGREFESRMEEILKAHPGARLASEDRPVLSLQGVEWTGWSAAFEFTDWLAFRLRRVASELRMFWYVGDRWTVKYRFTPPLGGAGAEDFEAFLRDLPWTVRAP